MVYLKRIFTYQNESFNIHNKKINKSFIYEKINLH